MGRASGGETQALACLREEYLNCGDGDLQRAGLEYRPRVQLSIQHTQSHGYRSVHKHRLLRLSVKIDAVICVLAS